MNHFSIGKTATKTRQPSWVSYDQNMEWMPVHFSRDSCNKAPGKQTITVDSVSCENPTSNPLIQYLKR